MQSEHHQSGRSRGIYLLPNLLTTASIFFGFFAVASAMKGRLVSAAIAIFVSMITDALDGRVARLTQSQSAFGAEYDSLSDMVSFGVAPALVVYKWALMGLGKVGWLIAFLFTVSVALRLARFNTQIKNADKRYFQGLSCTSGAGCIASMVWFGYSYRPVTLFGSISIALITLAISGLMVSNIRYRSFKELDPRGRIPFVTLLMIVLVFAGIAIDPPTVLLLITFGYAISGPMHTLIRIRQKRIARKKARIKKVKDSGS